MNDMAHMSNRGKVTLSAETVGEALLELLALRGVKYFFAGGTGTDFPPIIEAYAKRQATGEPSPIPITIVHEITTVAMAHGYTMVSGQSPFTMLHTIVGSALGLIGVINASTARVPLFLAAGRSSMTEKGYKGSRSSVIHWAQEAYDQAGMMRGFVRWNYELHHVENLETAIDRGFAMSRKAPAGPVYLTLPVEVTGQNITDLEVFKDPQVKPVPKTLPAASEIKSAVRALAAASSPVIIVTSMGRNPDAVAALVTFAERLAIPVIEFFQNYMNFPQDNPLHLGFEVDEFVRDADVILVIESGAPWIPTIVEPRASSTVIVLDEDPLHSNYAYRGFPNDITLAGDPEETLRLMAVELESVDLDDIGVSGRRAECARRHAEQRQTWQSEAQALSTRTPMDPKWISRCVVDQLQTSDIVVAEFILDATQTCFTQPGSYFDHAHSGGLGWSTGAALGAKLAAPDRTVVCCIGDGTYTFGVPVATHHTSALHDLPILFVIYNNAAWDRTRRAARGFAPDGYVSRLADIPLCELEPAPAYEKVCEAAGGYGERVDKPEDLPAALERAFRVVRDEGRQALLNVICSKI